ncbi:ABC transporter ATP-binding protein [Paenibacillus yanchengensis]|uniref:ABC transporter ATP-binding protein n=1 Tax=Paenibacillus yanchengensis TaxID=2035833 RepID=A0ABW4YQF1_9BACL
MLAFLKPYRLLVALKMVSTSLNAGNDIILVYFLNILVNAALSENFAGVQYAIIILFCSVLFGVGVNYLDTYSSGKFSAYVARDMKRTYSGAIDRLPLSYLETKHSADFSSRMSNSINAMEHFFNYELIAIFFHSFRITISIAVMFFINWQLTLFCIILLPIVALLTNKISQPLHQYSAKMQQSLAQTNKSTQDMISGIHLVKSYQLATLLFRKFKRRVHKMLAEALFMEKRKASIGSLSVFVQTAPFILFFMVGGYLVIQKQLALGGLVAFAMLLNYLLQGLGSLPKLIANLKVVEAIADDLLATIDVGLERVGGIKPAITTTVSAVQFEDVTFSYDGQTNILHSIHFQLAPLKKIALVGSSGSGKSTIFKLITAFYEHYSGNIKLFGHPLNEWDITYAREQIAVVSQDTFLYAGTIFHNLICGTAGVTLEAVVEAARSANIHDYIVSLPNGYDTIVGERGINLSGGQKQRIAIARAIIKNAPLILLDEATSALDTESEMLVQEALHRIMKDKTVLVIAHRLSTIKDADEVLVLERGIIVERGTHEQLLGREGAYKRLYEQQLFSHQTVTAIGDKGA